MNKVIPVIQIVTAVNQKLIPDACPLSRSFSALFPKAFLWGDAMEFGVKTEHLPKKNARKKPSRLFVVWTWKFTPRNEQTAEGRKSTEFAVKIRVNNPAGKLKSGMPAEVAFE